MPVDTSVAQQLRHQALQRLRSAVDVLISSWDITAELEGDVEDDRSSSQTHFAVRMRVRARRALERLNKTLPHEVLENVASYWDRERPMVRDFAQYVKAGLTRLASSRRRRRTDSSQCSRCSHRALQVLWQACASGSTRRTPRAGGPVL